MTNYDIKIFEMNDLLREVKKKINFEENSNLIKKDIDGVKGAFIIENFFTKNECKQLIDLGEELGYEKAGLNTLDGVNNDKAILSQHTLHQRNAYRAMCDIPTEYLEIMNKRMRDYLPKQVTFNKRLWDLCYEEPINGRFRFGKYEKGQYFKPHFDAGYAKSEKERTVFTLVFYLNDNCKGGELIFFPDGKTKSYLNKPDTKEVVIKPPEGSAIMFFLIGENSFRHEGAEIIGDEPKYIIRSEIFYKRNEEDYQTELKEIVELKKKSQIGKLKNSTFSISKMFFIILFISILFFYFFKK
jgi:prolyl 4-hydroxylase